MNVAIETRELITLDGLGVLLRGTYHKTHNERSSPLATVNEQRRMGVLFLNSLTLPRAATGDSAVYWADSFAEFGYPSFRVDLPGLGDTDGDLPVEVLGFINTGGYASIASSKVKELVERFNLSGVVIVGHCAGATSALYTAAVCKECRGVILMDAYFHLPQAIRPKMRRGLSDWALRSSLGGRLSNIYDLLRSVRLFFRGNAPPRNANFRLLGIWKQLASAGMPILIFKAPGRKAPGTKPRAGEFDYLKYVLKLAGRKSQVVVKLIEGTDHSFANRIGRLAVRRDTERWLNFCFPLTECEGSAQNTLHSEPKNDKDYSKTAEQCLRG